MAVARDAMTWSSALSRDPDAARAARETAASISAALGEGPVDLCMAFSSPENVAHAETIAASLRERLAPACLVAVSARGLIEGAHEIE